MVAFYKYVYRKYYLEGSVLSFGFRHPLSGLGKYLPTVNAS